MFRLSGYSHGPNHLGAIGRGVNCTRLFLIVLPKSCCNRSFFLTDNIHIDRCSSKMGVAEPFPDKTEWRTTLDCCYRDIVSQAFRGCVWTLDTNAGHCSVYQLACGCSPPRPKVTRRSEFAKFCQADGMYGFQLGEKATWDRDCSVYALVTFLQAPNND